MKICFVAPRYHTNQRAIIKGLLERNNEVCFYSVFQGSTEDYSFLQPRLLPMKNESNRLGLKDEMQFVENFELNEKQFYKELHENKPDLVIVRGKSKAMRRVYAICKSLHILCILYDQAPLFEEKKSVFKRIFRKIYNIGTPSIRYTPVKYANYHMYLNRDELVLSSKKSYYVPFVVDINCKAKEHYCENKKLHILDVGKYRSYKNHYALLKALILCKTIENIEVTVVGQATSDAELQYYDEMHKFCVENEIESYVSLVKNIDPVKMGEYYEKADVLVLCSHKEDASISVLESMSYGVPVISTSYNGTAFVIANDNGRVFDPKNETELASIIDELCENQTIVKELGVNARKYICENHGIENYIDSLNQLLSESGIGGEV